jgi:hypothetical protein
MRMAQIKKTRRLNGRKLPRRWLRAAAGLALWVGGGNLAEHALAQPAATNPEHAPAITAHLLNKHTIQLPIQLEERFRPLVKEIQLYYKEHPSAPWTLRDKALPTQASFTFKASHDGEYFFMMATIDRQGRCSPTDVAHEPPAMAVVLDTQKPKCEMVFVETVPEGQLVQCDVVDAHPDPSRTRVQYQTADKVFHDMEPLPDRPNVYCIPAQANTTGQLRAYVADLAGNFGTRECAIEQLPTPVRAVQHSPAQPKTVAQAPAAAPTSSPAATDQKLLGPQLALPEKGAPAEQHTGPAKQATPAAMPAVSSTPVTSAQAASAPATSAQAASLAAASAPAASAAAASGPAPAGSPTRQIGVSAGVNVGTDHCVVQRPALASGTPSKCVVTPTVSTSPPIQQATATMPDSESGPVIKQATPVSPTVSLPTIPAKHDGCSAHHMLVNSRRVFLDYRIEQAGASGVGRVEIWCTHDNGQSWKKLGDDRDCNRPVEAVLPGDGVYGLTLIVCNGLGFGGHAPVTGDTPDWWIEVDTVQPTAQITMVRMAREDGPAVEVGWTSQDRNLGGAPVELAYAVAKEGPWTPIAKGLKGDGQYRWVPPPDIGQQAFIRLTVRDLAGNSTITETTQPVALDDLSRPHAYISGISTNSGVSASSQK